MNHGGRKEQGSSRRLVDRIAAEPIRTLMQSSPLCVEPGDSVSSVLEAMRARRASCALIVDDAKLLGVFTERDYLDRIAGSPQLLSRPIDDYMSPQPYTLAPDATLAELLSVIVSRGYRHLPVVEASGPVGLVAAQDIVKYIADFFPTEVYNLPPRLDQVIPEVEGA